MKDLNRFTITGVLAAKPSISVTQSGMSILTLRVDMEVPTKVNGEWSTKTDQLECKMFGARADDHEGVARAGDRVCIEGKLNARTNERNGQTYVNITAAAETIVVMGRDAPGDRQPDRLASAIQDEIGDEELPF